MRVRVQRGTLHLEVGEAAPARRVEAVDGVAVFYDIAGQLAGIELHGIDPALLGSVTVELSDLPDQLARSTETVALAAPPRPEPAPTPRPPHAGLLVWEPEAEAAMLQIPFFSRGRVRLAAAALARRRGVDRVTLEIVRAVER